MESSFVNAKAGFGSDLLGQIKREAEGIVQLENIQAGQDLLVGLVQVLDHAVQDVHAGVNGLIEALFLGANNFLDIGFMLAQFGVTNLAGDDNGIHQISQERMVDAQHTAMAGSAAQ